MNKLLILRRISKSIINGGLIGVFCAIYKYIIEFILDIAFKVHTTNDLIIKILVIILSLLLSVVSFILIFIYKDLAGSGIHQIEHRRFKNDFNNYSPFKNILLMTLNTIISFFIGANVGSEAPNVFIGANIGIKSNQIFKDNDDDEIAISSGSAYSSAFLSPLAGLIYTFEEGKAKFNLLNLFRTILSIFVSYVVMIALNPHPLIPTLDLRVSNTSFYFLLPILGLIILLITTFIRKINPIIDKFLNTHKNNFFIKYRLLIYFIIIIAFSFISPYLSGSGIFIITNHKELNIWYIILLIFIIRFLMYIFTYHSTVSGGHLVPSLTLGLLIGLIFIEISSSFISLDDASKLIIVLISMFSFYGALYKLPLTSSVLAITIAGYKNIAITFLPICITMSFIFLPLFVSKLRKSTCNN